MKQLFLAGLCLVLLSGCASYSTSFRQVESLLQQQNPEAALQVWEKVTPPNRDRLLYVLNRAMLQRMNGLYVESNVSFEEAKRLIDKLKATSVAELAGTLVLNDSVRSYEGAPFEQVAIHVYEALNYIALGQLDDARVEALQVDVRLNSQKDADSSYQDDAFSRYLTGLIYEAQSELDDALVAYRKSYVVYQGYKDVSMPLYLKYDLLRLSEKLGLKDEYAKYQKEFSPLKVKLNNHEQQGEVVLIVHQGLAPIKRSRDIFVHSTDGVPLRISLPEYESRPDEILGGRLRIGEKSVDMILVNNFDTIARHSFERDKGAMVARLVARAVVKKALVDAAERKSGDAAGFLLDVAMMTTETADTRSWLTLPKNIHMSRMWLEPGNYPARLTLFGKFGEVVSEVDLGVLNIGKGQKTFVERTYIGPPRKKEFIQPSWWSEWEENNVSKDYKKIDNEDWEHKWEQTYE